MLSRASSALRTRRQPTGLWHRTGTTACPSTLFSPVPAILENINKTGTSDAFYVVNLAQVVRQHERWLKELPRVAPYYAVKCNNNPMLLQTLANLGCGFDCASPAEISQVRNLNVSSERIIYANPCKQPTHMKAARESGVNFTVFDSHDELVKIKERMQDAQLLLRLRPDDSQSVCRFGMKYGADLDEVQALLSTASSLDLQVCGVSFHVGSGCYAPESFADAVKMAADAFAIAEQAGVKMSLLDIGGGFPGEVQMPQATAAVEPSNINSSSSDDAPSFERPPPTFEAICAALRPALDEYFPASSGVRLLAEPGRYYVHASHTLATQVIGRKILEENGGQDVSYKYYLNDGIYGSFNCLMYDHAHVTPSVLPAPGDNVTASDRRAYHSSLWGPTCDGLDCIVDSVNLPELQVGDWVYFEQMGAYTAAASSSFNGFAPPEAQYFYDAVPAQVHEPTTQKFPNENVLPHVRLVADALGTTSG